MNPVADTSILARSRRRAAAFTLCGAIVGASGTIGLAQEDQPPPAANPGAPNAGAPNVPAPPAAPAANANANANAAKPAAFRISRIARVHDDERKVSRDGASVLDTVSGDDLRIVLDKAPPVSSKYLARFLPIAGGDAAAAPQALAWFENETSLRIRVPIVEATTSFELQLTTQPAAAGEAGVTSANTFPLRVAPPVNAIVESVSPAIAEFGKKTTLVKISGQGFFAPPEQFSIRIGDIDNDDIVVKRVSPLGDWFSAEIKTKNRHDHSYDAGTRNVSVVVWDVPAQVRVPNADDNTPVRLTLWRRPGMGTELLIGASAAATAIVVIVVLVLIYRTLKRPRGLLAALLFEPETQTYSLSRAQFFWWTTIIAYGYLFLFYGHGLHQGQWNFPPLQGFASTFLISLVTLVGAQATASLKGQKGAGVVRPSPSDLIVHGGVLAPERVQQVVWTLLGGVAFLWIVVKTYATADGLPEIPNELLALMGLSSAGYLGGKLARKAGPIIQRVEVSNGSVVLKVFGQHLSVNPRVLVDGVELSRESVTTLEPDPDHENEFVKGIKIILPATMASTVEDWSSQARVLAIINADTQRAEWRLDLPTVTNVEFSIPDSSGASVVTVSGARLDTGSVLIIPGHPTEIPLSPGAGTPPSQWTGNVTSIPTSQTDVTIRTAAGARVVFTWKPAAAPPAGASAAEAPPAGVPPAGVPPADVVEEHQRESDRAAEEPGTSIGT
jgi:hypothetical protein